MKLTEKQKNCPYCRSKGPDANLEIYKDGDYSFDLTSVNDAIKTIDEELVGYGYPDWKA